MALTYKVHLIDLDRILQRESNLDEEKAKQIGTDFYEGKIRPLSKKELTEKELLENKVIDAINLSDMKAKIELKNLIKKYPYLFLAHKYLIDYTVIPKEKDVLFEKTYETLKNTYYQGDFFTKNTELCYRSELYSIHSFIYEYVHHLLKKDEDRKAFDILNEFLEVSNSKPDELVDILSFLSVYLNEFETYLKYDRLEKDENDLLCYKYNHALYLYKTNGKSDEFIQLLTECFKRAPYIPAFLLDEEYTTKGVTEFTPASYEEALYYVNYAYKAWNEHEELLDLLSEIAASFFEDSEYEIEEDEDEPVNNEED